MTELKEMLNSAQLVKHYELLQFLTKHANQSYTFAQLDYYLPHGASVQRFPDEWLEFLREGGCGNRNIELIDDEGEDEAYEYECKHDSARNAMGNARLAQASAPGEEAHPTKSSSPFQAKHRKTHGRSSTATANLHDVLQRLRERRASMQLICRQPQVQDLNVLATLLQSPSTVLDAEGCVALHSDQIQLPLQLLQDAQRRRMVYYFPDKYDPSELMRRTIDTTTNGGSKVVGMNSGSSTVFTAQSQQPNTASLSSSSAQAASPRPEHESGHSIEQMWSLTTGEFVAGALLPHTFLHMPPGVSLRYKLLTVRGIVVQDELSFPTQLRCGERLVVVIDNVNAMRSSGGGGGAAQRLTFAYEFRGLKSAEGNAATPLRIRSRSLALPIAQSTAPPEKGQHPPPPRRLNAQETHTRASLPHKSAVQIRIEIEAVRSCDNFVLLIDVGGVSTAVEMCVSDVECTVPGVLIAQEKEPSNNLRVPQSYVLMDRVVYPSWSSADHERSVAGPGEPASREEGQVAKQQQQQQVSSHNSLLPSWWQTSSPLVSVARHLSYPTELQVNMATGTIFTEHTLRHEMAQRKARVELQQRREQEESEVEAGRFGKRQRRRARSSNFDLRNKHMFHFGLDASVPFVRQGGVSGAGEVCTVGGDAPMPNDACC